MLSAVVIADDKRNLYSPEIFLYDKTFDPNKHNLNSPSFALDDSTGKNNWILIRYKIILIITLEAW